MGERNSIETIWQEDEENHPKRERKRESKRERAE